MPVRAEAEVPGPAQSRTSLDAGLPSLRAFFTRRVHANDVDDMVQDVALRLHACGRRDAVQDGRAYLFQVARSVMTDRARRDATRLRGKHEPLTMADHPVEEISPARVLEAREQLALVLEAMHSLPERTRQVFVLHRFEMVSHAAIAAQLGISISSVEKHVMNAIKLLVAKLAA